MRTQKLPEIENRIFALPSNSPTLCLEEQKDEPETLKNKKCQRPLPEGYKYKYCEHCRSERAQKIKNAGKATLGVAVMVVGTAVTVITKGNINPNKK